MRDTKRALTQSILLALTFCAAAIAASTATAAQPIITRQIPFSFTTPLNPTCPFDVTVNASGTITETDFVDDGGVLTHIKQHVDEQDTFSANGNSLQGLPYTYNLDIVFDPSGEITSITARGVLERIPLPDGSLVLAAGVQDLLSNSGFGLTMSVGVTKNVAGFCAALS